MANFREEIESRIGSLGLDYIDPTPTLSKYYGPNSLACHGLRRLDETHVESYFIVPQNLCGEAGRPPMFDRLTLEDGIFITQTDEVDAREHFIDEIVINGIQIRVVQGHKIAGLVVEAGEVAYNQGRETSVDLMLTEFGFIRYRGFILPRQEVVLTGALTKDDQEVVFSPDITVSGQSRTKANKFRLEVVDPKDKETKKLMMKQHWLLETTAQGFGSAASLDRSVDGMVPVLMQSEKSTFAKTPVVAGDLITTRFELLPSPPEQGFGNAEIFVNGVLYGTQRRLLVQFFPIEKIAEGIAAATKLL